MTLTDLKIQFNNCKSWEERYRLLIQLSRQLPKLSEEELANLPEISGCESRLWFSFQKQPRAIRCFSDARLMQGLLVILNIALTEMSEKELATFDIQALYDELNITRHLTSTRLNGLKNVEEIIRQS